MWCFVTLCYVVNVLLQPSVMIWAQNNLLSMQFFAEPGKLHHIEHKPIVYTRVHLSHKCIKSSFMLPLPLEDLK